MADPHLSPSDVEHYVLGALDPDAERKLEAHTLECDACARLLQREAQLEEQLREVASTAPRGSNVIRPTRWRLTRVAVPALAAAAALALVLLRPETVSEPVREAPTVLSLELPVAAPNVVVACPDLSTQESCAEEAAARGLLVQYPVGMGEVPRYEGSEGLPAGALSSRPASL
ncbi:hypothetical protein [Hyalangium rubrum]|uniref:Zinc-finger domain-containing protein n=1 Tax=Hyalangium rubrum TaxID=3103134 RepID=A0ABU5H6U7_9BACT|nr:hypothetical protein [Hyalangium sp. s54d21]MDY7229188.1 hypothetical protein [Hyalangium sp. s54d21]